MSETASETVSETETAQERIARLTPEVAALKGRLDLVRGEVGKVLVGQRYMVDRLLIGMLAGGHLLLEGVPGLAKTTAVKALAEALSATFSRIQFTPDLLPADVLGTQIYNPRDASFSTRQGPVFAHLVLADEINRAPAKVQSALLEAMQEKQVTLGGKTQALPEPFLVMATQNPLDSVGTYPLPLAQLDRFLFKIKMAHIARQAELEVLASWGKPRAACNWSIISPSWLVCTNASPSPKLSALAVHRFWMSCRVVGPYTSGWRVPSRLRFGPFNMRIDGDMPTPYHL